MIRRKWCIWIGIDEDWWQCISFCISELCRTRNLDSVQIKAQCANTDIMRILLLLKSLCVLDHYMYLYLCYIGALLATIGYVSPSPNHGTSGVPFWGYCEDNDSGSCSVWSYGFPLGGLSPKDGLTSSLEWGKVIGVISSVNEAIEQLRSLGIQGYDSVIEDLVWVVGIG